MVLSGTKNGSSMASLEEPFKHLYFKSVCTNMQVFASQKVKWWTGVVWIIVKFLSAVWTHFDGTHSLQRIHWGASDVMLNFSKSFLMKKKLIYILDDLWPWVIKFSANFNFWVNYTYVTVNVWLQCNCTVHMIICGKTLFGPLIYCT